MNVLQTFKMGYIQTNKYESFSDVLVGKIT